MPDFSHRPMLGSWSMLAYNGGPPIEYNLRWPTVPAAIIRRARFKALYAKRQSVKVRDGKGLVIYDGDSGDDY